jgi:hypothetical protein
VRKLLRIVAAFLALVGLAVWLASGANRGWTKNRVEKRTVDEVTGIEGITYEDRFVPGVDFLGGTLVGAGLLAGVSFLIRKRDKVI